MKTLLLALLLIPGTVFSETLLECIDDYNALLDDYNICVDLNNKCVDDGYVIAVQLDACNASYAALYKLEQQWEQYGNYQKKLVKRLRKACGPRCKKIK